ncbi:probable acyl-activating enzyme 17, peroxisomal [Corylus avellana]|uniref:probable acyl-activating enzyme 17, peroxisomal n=1 Tax=Corylus avellana TaxID=13451 RepID=UPI00286B1987|nr:probable acyl-activating enzyme 17, peroxisomal [Corylus avellana]
MIGRCKRHSSHDGLRGHFMWVEKLGKDAPLSVLQRHKVGFIGCMYSFFGLFSGYCRREVGFIGCMKFSARNEKDRRQRMGKLRDRKEWRLCGWRLGKKARFPGLGLGMNGENAISTNVGQLLERRGKRFLGPKYKDSISSFPDFQEFLVSNPEVYWRTVLDELGISFSMPPQCILRESTFEESISSYPGGRWLPDTIFLVAQAIKTLGLDKRSAVAIDMLMNVNYVVIYLAIVLAGYVVVSIADSFAPIKISTRLKISEAKAIFTQDLISRGDKSQPLYKQSFFILNLWVNYPAFSICFL